MYQTNFDFIADRARELEKPLRVAIAGADAENVLLGAFQAEAEGFAELYLFGNEKKIIAMLKELALYARKYTIINVPEDQDVVQACIDYIKAGNADCLMRGTVQTREFLMPILDKKNDLVPQGRILSHIALLRIPEYRRVLAISDVSVVVEPSIEQRKQIIKNTVNTLLALGYDKPNVALMSLIEYPAFHMRDTVEAQTIVRDHAERPIAPCNIVGPIAYDLIISKEAARLKNYDCDLCGEFDAIVTPNLLAGNVLLKAVQIHGHASGCGVLVGSTIPIAITSRSEPKEQAYLSVAACAALTQPKKVEWSL